MQLVRKIREGTTGHFITCTFALSRNSSLSIRAKSDVDTHGFECC